MDVADIIEGVDGWCTLRKANALYSLASRPECQIAIEIGIYGGRSLLPVAAAFASKNSGLIFGIEPWSNDIAVETATSDRNDEWWATVDLLAIKRAFFSRAKELQLEGFIRLLELPSDAAILVFQSPRYSGQIDLIHIDGSHSTEQSVLDCACWFRLLRSGGHLVLDDINWPSIKVALDFLKSVATLVELAETEEDGHYAVFKKQ